MIGFKVTDENGRSCVISAINFGTTEYDTYPAQNRKVYGRIWVEFGLRTILNKRGQNIGTEIVDDK